MLMLPYSGASHRNGIKICHDAVTSNAGLLPAEAARNEKKKLDHAFIPNGISKALVAR